ncbi:metallophosphoesterase [Streptomyces lavendulae]|uniref:metallophosphoesterase n=1 Tax=Streptomyces lavendulae TaxID=1914 RepID=UPI0031EF645C
MTVVVVVVAVVAVLALLALVHRWLWVRLVRDTTRAGGAARRTGTVLAFALPVLALAALTAGRAGAPFWLQQVVAWPGYMWLAVLLYLTLAMLVAEPARRLWLRRLSRTGAAAAAAPGTPGPGAPGTPGGPATTSDNCPDLAGTTATGATVSQPAAAGGVRDPQPAGDATAVGAEGPRPATAHGARTARGATTAGAQDPQPAGAGGAGTVQGTTAVGAEPPQPAGAHGAGTVQPAGAHGAGTVQPARAGGAGTVQPVGAGGVGAAQSVGAHGAGAVQPVGAGGVGGPGGLATAEASQAGGVGGVPLSRRVFVARVAGGAAAAAALATVGTGTYGVLRGPRVKRVQVPLARLPRAAHGFRIAVVSDVHLGPVLGRAHTQRIVDTVNRTQPDLIAVVGDLVDGSVHDLGPAAEPLRLLRSRLGSYFVTGNHEYFSGARQWVDHVRELGLTPLENARRELPHFDLAGVNDVQGESEGQGPDFRAALGDRDRSRTAVLLAHQPVVIHDAVRHGVDLQLSGHTHGGQLWPGNYLAELANPTVAGLERYGDTQLYVSRGAGAWGPPVRVGAPSDITVVELASYQA